MRPELANMISAARKRLFNEPVNEVLAEDLQRMDAFRNELARKVPTDLRIELMGAVQMRNGTPTLVFTIDDFTFLLSQEVSNDGTPGWDLIAGGLPSWIADDDKFNDRLLVEIGNALETTSHRG